MRVTLVQPPQGTRFGFSKVLRVEPLGLECVGSALRLHGHEVHLVDLRLDRPSALRDHLRSWRPQGVGLTCGFTTDVFTTLQAAQWARDALPEAAIFVGGHHASLVPGDFLFQGSPVEAVVVGEGETTGADLVDALECRSDPGAVPGVLTLWNHDRGFRPRAYSDQLDSFPLPDRSLTKRYRARYHQGLAAPSACVETSRGCPFDCNFCSIWVFYGRRARRFSPERITEDLRQVKRLGGDHVFFTDDIAFLNRDLYQELAESIRRAGIRMSYTCETRADLVVKYRDLFQTWQELGMGTIFLGIEKIDDAGLAAVRKRTKGGVTTNVDAIEILRSCGITAMTSLITDPSWGEEDFDRLEEFVRLLRLTDPSFSILTPLPGTELWESLKGQLTTDDYSRFDIMHLVLPARLGEQRFYERFARLYRLTEPKTRVTWEAARTFVGLALRGQAWVMRRVLGAVHEMRSPREYLRHPGSAPRPDFAPPAFGSASWVDRGRSYLSLRVAAPGTPRPSWPLPPVMATAPSSP